MENENDFGFLLKSLIGGIIGGILSSIPILNMLNCCFCLLNGAGAALGVTMHLRADPENRMSMAHAAISGAVSGLIAGLMATVAGPLTTLVLGKTMGKMFREMGMPRDVVKGVSEVDLVTVISQTCISLPMYVVFGVLFAIATLKLMHEDQCID